MRITRRSIDSLKNVCPFAEPPIHSDQPSFFFKVVRDDDPNVDNIIYDGIDEIMDHTMIVRVTTNHRSESVSHVSYYILREDDDLAKSRCQSWTQVVDGDLGKVWRRNVKLAVEHNIRTKKIGQEGGIFLSCWKLIPRRWTVDVKDIVDDVLKQQTKAEFEQEEEASGEGDTEIIHQGGMGAMMDDDDYRDKGKKQEKAAQINSF